MDKDKLIIAVDFDGTCVKDEFPEVGDSIGAENVLKDLISNGHKIILWTVRSNEKLEKAKKWFQDNDIELFGINENPEQKEWSNSPKAHADLFIDDKALGCPLIFPEDEQPYVDWNYIKKIPTNKNIKKTFFELISSLEEIGFIADTCENDEGEIYIYITDENLDAINYLCQKSVTKGDVKLTALEQKFYDEFIHNLSTDEIENESTEICYKGGIEGMTVYQIGAILSTLKEKGVISNIDKKNKVATIKILK